MCHLMFLLDSCFKTPCQWTNYHVRLLSTTSVIPSEPSQLPNAGIPLGRSSCETFQARSHQADALTLPTRTIYIIPVPFIYVRWRNPFLSFSDVPYFCFYAPSIFSSHSGHWGIFPFGKYWEYVLIRSNIPRIFQPGKLLDYLLDILNFQRIFPW